MARFGDKSAEGVCVCERKVNGHNGGRTDGWNHEVVSEANERRNSEVGELDPFWKTEASIIERISM